MTNKNPYEIRLEVMQMARDYLSDQYHTNLNFAHQAYMKALETGKAMADTWKDHLPKMYGVDEITKKAEELYSFICSGNSKNENKECNKK